MEIGNKIRRIRLQRGLTQEELADRCELSKGFISLLERDLTSPSLDTLADILESLGTDLPTFFAKHDAEKIVFGEDDIFVKEDDEQLRGVIRWLVPSAQKNRLWKWPPAEKPLRTTPTRARNSAMCFPARSR